MNPETALRVGAISLATFCVLCAAPAINGADKAAVIDALTQHYAATQLFVRDGMATGGTLRLPDSRRELPFANAGFNWDDGWQPQDSGTLYRHTRRLAGGTAWRETETVSREHSVAASFGDTFRWRTRNHTEFYFYMDLGYLNLRKHPAAVAASSPAPAAINAHLLTSFMDAGISHSIPLGFAPLSAFTEAPESAWLRLSARFGNLMQYGYRDRFGGSTLFINTFAWSLGAEYTAPQTALAGQPVLFAPFVSLTGIHDDGNRALSGDGRFFQAGLRTSLFVTDSADAAAVSAPISPRPAKTVPAPTPQFTLTLNFFWGENCKGWQLGAGFSF